MSIPVPVRLSVAPSIGEVVAPALLAESVRDAAVALLASLGVPAEPHVEAGASLPSDASGPPWRIDIGGARARTAWRPDPPGDRATLEALIGRDLARNAELFLTADVIDALSAAWTAHADLPDLPREELAGLLRECLRLGCSIERLFEADLSGDDRDPPGWRRIESALEAAATLRITVPARFLQGEDGAALAESLRASVHGNTGVILPTVEIRGNDDEEDDSLRIEALDVVHTAPARDFEGLPVERLAAAIEPWLPSFVVRETTLFLVVAARRTLPLLVDAVRRRYSDAFLTRTCRALVAEGIGVTDFRAILGGLLEIREPTTADEKRRIVFHSPAGTAPPALALSDGRLDPEDAADCVRRWARRRVTTRHWETGTLRARLLDPGLEDLFRAGGVRPGSDTQERFLERLRGSADPILTNVDVRRRVFEAIALERSDVPVLCYQELLPETSILPTERVAL